MQRVNCHGSLMKMKATFLRAPLFHRLEQLSNEVAREKLKKRRSLTQIEKKKKGLVTMNCP